MKYVLFVKDGCPYCVMAREQLQDNGLDYSEVNFEPSQEQVLNEIKKIYEWGTVPMIFEKDKKGNSKFIGGYTDLVKYLKNE